MEIRICKDPVELGTSAAREAAAIIRECIAKKGSARIALSTGASQFDTLKALVREDVDWSKVEMFHLDEYVGISEEHPASFKRYLLDRGADFRSRRIQITASQYTRICRPEIKTELHFKKKKRYKVAFSSKDRFSLARI